MLERAQKHDMGEGLCDADDIVCLLDTAQVYGFPWTDL